MKNPINCTDFYKTSHHKMYPEGTTQIYSNFTPRSARLFNGSKYYDDKVVVFGIQLFIKDFLIDEFQKNFFNKKLTKVLMKYKRRMDTSLGEGAVSTDHIKALHELGYLPIHIKALPEGTRCPIKVPVLTITNTHPDFFWLTNYLETVLSTELWKPMTTATIAFEYLRTFHKYADLTGASKEFIPFQGHDFSARGLSNREDGYKASIGHLTSFVGTDTIRAIDGAEDFYNADSSKELVGCSVPATEHSVMALSTKDAEIATFKRLITELYPSGIISIVSDTWDFWKVLTDYLPALKQDILDRKPDALGNAKVVIRPDSGDPVDIICGTAIVADLLTENQALYTGYRHTGEHMIEVPYLNSKTGQYYLSDVNNRARKHTPTPKDLGAIQLLWNTFGGTVNDKGYKTLNPRIGLIYGDSITLARQEEILSRLEQQGFASDNVVFGIGSYSYQYNTRDTFGFAMKATYGIVDGEPREIFKDPITDSGTKKSAKGLLCVHDDAGQLTLEDQVSPELEQSAVNALQTMFYNGGLTFYETSLEDIRARLRNQL